MGPMLVPVTTPPAPPSGKKPTKEASIAIEVAGIVVRVEAGVNPGVAGGRAAGGEGSMISLPAGVRVLVATRPVDFRKGADGLAALVRETLRLLSGMISCFAPNPPTAWIRAAATKLSSPIDFRLGLGGKGI
jgi:hypothetical protein